MMRQRQLIPERMDDPKLGSAEHLWALRGLRRINAWTRNASLFWKHLPSTKHAHDGKPLRLLDIATGSADIPIALMRIGASRGVRLEIEACDVSEQALAFASQKCAEAGVSIRLFRHDIVRDPLPEQYDVVMCSQFMHHLETATAEQVLEKLKSTATTRVIIVDLERGLANWLQVWMATRALSRSPVVHFDGPQSVRAAFSLAEFAQLAAQAGFSSPRLQRTWPCRFVFVGETHGSQ